MEEEKESEEERGKEKTRDENFEYEIREERE